MKNQTNDPGGDHLDSCVSMVTKEVVQGWNLDLQQACNSCLHPPELDVWKIHFMENMSRNEMFCWEIRRSNEHFCCSVFAVSVQGFGR